MKPIKIAQIGSGHDHAPMTFRSLLKQKDCFEVVGFAEPNPQRQVPEMYQTVPNYSVEELLELPYLEAVAIECEERFATDIAQRFAEKKIAIHLDKPGSQDSCAFEKLINTLKADAIPFHTGYMYRYNPSVRHLFSMKQKGELGEIYSVEAQMSCRHPREKRQWLAQFQGGMMFYLGCHLVDLILQLQGTPKQIIPLNKVTGSEDVTAEDFGFVVFEYEKGVSFIKSCASEENGYARRQLVVLGSKGSYEIKPWEVPGENDMLTSPTRLALTEKNAACKWADLAENIDFGAYDRYDDMMRDFAEIVRGKENSYSYDYEWTLFKTLMQCCGC